VRGSPLLRAFLAFCLIAAFAWPLWHLTHPMQVVAAAPAQARAENKDIGLQMDFTVLPKRFVVRYLEKDLWTETAPQASMEHQLSLVFPDKGVDLVFHIEWPDDAPLAAARVRLTDPAGDTHEKSVWGQGTVDEVLTFP
jgi:hypothetical protein